jgi:hypothetical protein
MKLAEALILRADYQKRIEQLKLRLQRNAKVQEGDAPAENPQLLLEEFETLVGDLGELIRRINRTNSTVHLAGEQTIADAIVQRDGLRMRHTVYRDLAHHATVTQERHTKSEVKFLGTVNVAEIQKEADRIALEHRKLDAQIQALNWQTELVDS